MPDQNLAVVEKPQPFSDSEKGLLKPNLVRKTIFDLSDQEFTRLDKMAHIYAVSSFNNNKGQKYEDYWLIMLKGMELGFQPMAAVSMISIIKGQPALDGKGMLALIYASELLEDIQIDSSDTACTVIMTRKGVRSPFRSTFTIEDARKMELVEGKSGKTNYQKQPKIMLKWRAIANCSREAFPDVLGGLYTMEEMSPENVTVFEDGAMEITVPLLTESSPPRDINNVDEWVETPERFKNHLADITAEAITKFSEACEKFFGMTMEAFLDGHTIEDFSVQYPDLDSMKQAAIEAAVTGTPKLQLRVYGVKTEAVNSGEGVRYLIPFGFGSVYAYSRKDFEDNTDFDAHGDYYDHINSAQRNLQDIGNHSFAQVFKRDYLLMTLRYTEAKNGHAGGKLAIESILDPITPENAADPDTMPM